MNMKILIHDQCVSCNEILPLLHENNNYIFAYAIFRTTEHIYECIPIAVLHKWGETFTMTQS